MSIKDFAMEELRLINHPNAEEIVELIELCGEGHSGFSINYVISSIEHEDYSMTSLRRVKERLQSLSKEDRGIIVKLLSWLPLSELTIEDSDWDGYVSMDGEMTYQHKRLSKLFKNGINGKPYLINRLVFVNQHGDTFGSGFYRRVEDGKLVKYNLLPKQLKEFPRVYVDCLEYEIGEGDYEFFVSEEDLKKVTKFYDLEIKEIND